MAQLTTMKASARNHLKFVIICITLAMSCSQIARANEIADIVSGANASNLSQMSEDQIADGSMTEIFSRDQGSKTFKFYAQNKKIIAVCISDGETVQLPISGIPANYLADLTIDKIEKLQAILNGCFFDVQRQQIVVHGRIEGGWSDNVHRGYVKPDDIAEGEFVIHELVPFDKVNGTYTWAQDMGFGLRDAKAIADACVGIDEAPETQPLQPNKELFRWKGAKIRSEKSVKYPQSWHFNLAWGDGEDGSARDSRMLHAARCLWDAITLMNKNEAARGEALRELGKGLHPLQDAFAHTKHFTHKHLLDFGPIFWAMHFKDTEKEGADNPFCSKLSMSPDPVDEANKLNERYALTRMATYLYLLFYHTYTQYNKEYSQIDSVAHFQQLVEVALFKDKCKFSISSTWKEHLEGFLQAFFAEKKKRGSVPVQIRNSNISNFERYLESLVVRQIVSVGETVINPLDILEELKGDSQEEILSDVRLQLDEILKHEGITQMNFATELEEKFIPSSSLVSATPDELIEMRMLSFYALALLERFNLEQLEPNQFEQDSLYTLYSDVGVFLNRIAEDYPSAERSLNAARRIRNDFRVQVCLIDVLTKMPNTNDKIEKILTEGLGFEGSTSSLTAESLPNYGAMEGLSPKQKSRILTTLGRWLGNTGREAEALKALESALAINRDINRNDYIAATLANIAEIKFRQGRRAEAEKDRKEVIRLNINFATGDIYRAMGHYRLALFLKADKKPLEALDNLILAYYLNVKAVGIKNIKTVRVVKEIIDIYGLLDKGEKIDKKTKGGILRMLGGYYNKVVSNDKDRVTDAAEQELKDLIPKLKKLAPRSRASVVRQIPPMSAEQQRAQDKILIDVSRRYVKAIANADTSGGKEVLWGGDIELIEIAKLRGLRIVVYQQNAYGEIVRNPAIGPRDGRQIALWFDNNHYQNYNLDNGSHTTDVPADGNCLFHAALRAEYNLDNPAQDIYQFNSDDVAVLRGAVARNYRLLLRRIAMGEREEREGTPANGMQPEMVQLTHRNDNPIYARFAAIVEATDYAQLQNAINLLPPSGLRDEVLIRRHTRESIPMLQLQEPSMEAMTPSLTSSLAVSAASRVQNSLL